MEKARGKSYGTKSPFSKAVRSLLWFVFILLAGSAVVAWMVDGGLVGIEGVSYGVLVILLAGSFLTALMAMGNGNCVWKGLAVHVAGIMAVLLLGNLVLGIGAIKGLLPTLLVVVAGCVSALLFKLKPKKAKSYTRRKWGGWLSCTKNQRR